MSGIAKEGSCDGSFKRAVMGAGTLWVIRERMGGRIVAASAVREGRIRRVSPERCRKLRSER